MHLTHGPLEDPATEARLRNSSRWTLEVQNRSLTQSQRYQARYCLPWQQLFKKSVSEALELLGRERLKVQWNDERPRKRTPNSCASGVTRICVKLSERHDFAFLGLRRWVFVWGEVLEERRMKATFVGWCGKTFSASSLALVRVFVECAMRTSTHPGLTLQDEEGSVASLELKGRPSMRMFAKTDDFEIFFAAKCPQTVPILYVATTTSRNSCPRDQVRRARRRGRWGGASLLRSIGPRITLLLYRPTQLYRRPSSSPKSSPPI
jgi:hypothetical protein